MSGIKLLWSVLCIFLLMNRSQAQSSDSPYQLQVFEGQSLLEAIDQLADDYEIDFAYAPHVLDQAHLEAAQLFASNIESLLRQLLAEVPVQYRIVSDNRILLRGISLKDEASQKSSLSLKGRVIDATTGVPMMNVAIALDTLNLGALSDEQGTFNFKVSSFLEDRIAWIYHIGYKTKQIPIADFKNGRTISLEASSIALHEVLITDKLPSIASSLSDGSIVMRKEGLKRGFASQVMGPDIFRDVQLMPGINADNDLSTDIRIRGSNADETLIVLDGMPLYKVDHFFGVFSALNSSYIEEVRLFKNAMPIQYGGRTGGLLLLQSTKDITEFGGELNTNLLSTALKLDIPVSPNLGLSLSGRRSHTNVAASKFFDWVGEESENYIEIQQSDSRPDFINTTPDFGFSDWNGKLLFSPNEKHRFALNFYQSNDDFLNAYEYSIIGRLNQSRTWHQEIFEDRQDWQNIGTSLQYESTLTNNWRLEADAFYTRYVFSDALKIDINRLLIRRNTTNQLDTVNISLRNNRFNLVENGGYRTVLSKDYGGDRLLEIGSGWNYHKTDFAISSEVETLLSNQASSYDAQIFANYQWSPLDRLKLSVGGRLNYYQQTEGIYFSPRIRANYLFENGLSLKAAYNVNYQFIREITYENRLGQSIDLILLSNMGDFPVGQSTNYMLGANYQYKNWFFDVELYYKKRANVIEYASTNLGFGTQFVGPGQRQRYDFFQGTGKVFGLDAMISWDYSRYSGHIAYTWSKATNEFPTILDGDPVPARDDRRHQLKWVNIWKQGRFDFSANFIYTSGRPYYDVRRITENEENRQRRFINWLPSYQRLDVGVAYRFSIGSSKAKIGASIFNVTNHDNVKYLQFIYSATSERNNMTINSILGSQTDLLDRTLNLSFGLEF